MTEASKLAHLSTADVLVLPSDRSNEAFGIVQLEAMAAGMPALAFCCERSGMGWVGALPGLIWSQQPAELASVLQRLAGDAQLCGALSVEARDRYQQQFCRGVWQQQLISLRVNSVSLGVSNSAHLVEPSSFSDALLICIKGALMSRITSSGFRANSALASVSQNLPNSSQACQSGRPDPSAGKAQSMEAPKRVVLKLENVGLDIPVFTTETRSLKSTLIRSVTGGGLKRRGGGAVITALEGVTCEIREGDRVALIGHNGAGKSSFLRLISDIYQHTSGLFEAYVRVFPMIHKSFITSAELSGLQAIKAHYLMVNGNLKGFQSFCDDVIAFFRIR